MTRTTRTRDHVADAAPSRDAESDPALEPFHPAVKRWFRERFRRPTAPQRRGWEAIRSGEHTLVAAPTGSGKTLAAFLHALDELLREGIERDGLPDETRVVYVSPLKALSADIHRNLAQPRKGIRRELKEMGLPGVRITAAVRTGDTPRSERRAMVDAPPHILVTTPESLYLLLTAERSREFLRTVRSVVVDEIHAVIESRRGSHLALSLERLHDVTGGGLQRIGLSATQRPVREVARFLVGAPNVSTGSEGAPAVAGGDAGEDGGAGEAGAAGEDVASGSPGAEGGDPHCRIVDEGHLQRLDLSLEVPESPLQAVMSTEVREEVHDRLAELVGSHRTTLVFVNTRREAERVAHSLSERLGEEAVTAHHGSLSRETRLDAERRLEQGELRALVATASMELGIDIGHVDLVCQLGSPNRIATFLQRVGRSGHTVDGTPRGRLFPQTRDDLVECAALLRSVRRGELDRVQPLDAPLDILAQQLVAEAACGERGVEEMFRLFRRAWPYRDVTPEEFRELVTMLSRGVATSRGRRGTMLHHDAVNGRIRGRRGARMFALTCGGAIPDNADYRVVLEPDGTFLGTVNEDFAVESLPGDVFQLGNTSWRVRKVETGVMRVEDARGEAPTMPFWFGEAPARSEELSAAVAELRRDLERRLTYASEAESGTGPGAESEAPSGATLRDGDACEAESGVEGAAEWLATDPELTLSRPVARQIAEYLAESKRILGSLPSRETLVLERFFDESGGMQLVLHAPFGSRVNRAWGLALRKRFCRKFNFELQAAATEDAVLLSLGPQHSFPMEEIFGYLHPDRVGEVLEQAVLDAPMFQTRWRWCATLSLTLLRWRGGRKVPPQIQRMEAEDLLAAVFPDATACLENVAGEREIPDHPLVRQTLTDCLQEVMDLAELRRVLRRIRAGRMELVVRDTPEPSPLCHEVLTARPYAFLDDAPLEERRAQAVRTRRALEPSAVRELGALDEDAIARVRDEAWPRADNPDELHDALLLTGFLRGDELGEDWRPLMADLADARRAVRVRPDGGGEGTGDSLLWVAAERLAESRLAWPEAREGPAGAGAERKVVRPPTAPGDDEPEDAAEAVRGLLRSRLEVVGPVTIPEMAAAAVLPVDRVKTALLELEAEGTVLRGDFTGEAGDRDAEEREWCHRRLLARIHRYTIQRLREAIRPVSAADFTRFLFRLQRAAEGHRVAGEDGLAAVLEILEGVEIPAAAWESEVLPLRCEDYEPEMLDRLCAAGRVVWGRLSQPEGRSPGLRSSGPLRTTPVALWRRAGSSGRLSDAGPGGEGTDLTEEAARVREVLDERGASFFDELVAESGLLPTRVERALGELAGLGLVTSDGFAGLRALLTPSDRRKPLAGAASYGGAGSAERRRGKRSPWGVDTAGRWSLLRDGAAGDDAGEVPPGGTGSGSEGTRNGSDGTASTEAWAQTLLARYGVVFRALARHEDRAPPWRDLLRIYWRMEARGEIRGGRFVTGFSGEQFALPEAVGKLRAVRDEKPSGALRTVSAADPLNLTGVVTPGARIPAVPSNRIGYRDGVPVLALVGGEVRGLDGVAGSPTPEEERALVRRPVPKRVLAYLGTSG